MSRGFAKKDKNSTKKAQNEKAVGDWCHQLLFVLIVIFYFLSLSFLFLLKMGKGFKVGFFAGF